MLVLPRLAVRMGGPPGRQFGPTGVASARLPDSHHTERVVRLSHISVRVRGAVAYVQLLCWDPLSEEVELVGDDAGVRRFDVWAEMTAIVNADLRVWDSSSRFLCDGAR